MSGVPAATAPLPVQPVSDDAAMPIEYASKEAVPIVVRWVARTTRDTEVRPPLAGSSTTSVSQPGPATASANSIVPDTGSSLVKSKISCAESRMPSASPVR